MITTKRTKQHAAFPRGKRKLITVKLPESIAEAVKMFGDKACLEFLHTSIILEKQREARKQMADRALAKLIFGKIKK